MNILQISFLLYCGVVMVTAEGNETNTNETISQTTNTTTTIQSFSSSQTNKDAQPTTTSPENTKATHGPNTTPPKTNPTNARDNSDCLFEKREGGIVLLVMGGLVVLCTVLLVCTLALACQVCHLKRHYRSSASSRSTRSNIDLVSGAGHWGTSQRAKERPGIDAELVETSLLIADLKHTQDGEGQATDNQGNGKDTTAEVTPKTEGGEGATAKDQDGSTSNGVVGPAKASSPSKPEVTTATSTTSDDVAVVVG